MKYSALSILALTVSLFTSNVHSAAWKPLGGDLALVGPDFNATFKAGDKIPFEYTFYTLKGVNGTASTVNTAQATITGLQWLGNTGSKALDLAIDNGRNTGVSATCLSTDICSGTYYPKGVSLQIPTDYYAGNYTLQITYNLSLAVSTTSVYKQPIMIAKSDANITSPAPLLPASVLATSVTLPELPAPSGAMANAVSKVLMATAMLAVSGLLMV